MRPSTLQELGAEHGIALPRMDDLTTFPEFVALYVAATDVLRGEDDLRRLVRELAEDARADGAVWVETFVYPPLWLGRFGDDLDALDLFLELARDEGRAVGVGIGTIVTADRTADPGLAEHWARLAVSRRDAGVVGFGLANDETHFPPEPFEAAFAIAIDGGLLSLPHAGELAGPASVRGALDVLHADRLGHGVRAIEDPDLVERIAEDGVPCDVSVQSNLKLGLYPSIAEHAIGVLVDAGVRVTINTDDPLMFGYGLVQEYELIQAAFGWSHDEMAAIARTSIEVSGAPAELKAATLGTDPG
jgi:adenosine deaminase